MHSRNSSKQKKKKPYIKWGVFALFAFVVSAAAFWLYVNERAAERSEEKPMESEIQNQEAPPAGTSNQEETEIPEEPAQESAEPEPPATEDGNDATRYPENSELPEQPTIVDGILLANKQHPLPETYAPGEDKKARAAFESMREAALEDGIDLVAFSTYRDFARQEQLYKGYVAKDGQEAADRYSARPGFSEHQTGLAFDIGEAGQEQHWASASFGGTEGGKWLAEHAHQFGFILRYPEARESTTGYMHEAWHFRYVGNEAAEKIREKDITLEEYLKVQ